MTEREIVKMTRMRRGGGDVMTRTAFLNACRDRALIDYDGFGYPARGSWQNTAILLKPSDPKKAAKLRNYTHVVWFNR